MHLAFQGALVDKFKPGNDMLTVCQPDVDGLEGGRMRASRNVSTIAA
jgi:hypothetical protein